MNSKMSRDTKDPMPNANNSMRISPDGNSPVAGEDHGSKKAERILGSQRYTLRTGGETQPTRQNEGGNVPVAGEDHAQGKAEHVTGAQRGGQNTAGTTANSPGR